MTIIMLYNIYMSYSNNGADIICQCTGNVVNVSCNEQCLDIKKSLNASPCGGDLAFKFFTAFDNNGIKYNYLGLCNNIVTFDDVCCLKDASSLILAIPVLVYADKCHVYRLNIDPANISDYVSVYLNDNISSPVMITAYINGGYLYIVIPINPTTDIDGCKITLTFTLFQIPLIKSLMCPGNYRCKPVLWLIGTTVPLLGTTTTEPV